MRHSILHKILFVIILLSFGYWLLMPQPTSAQDAKAPAPLAKHVVIIGIDGLSVDGVKNSRMPNLNKLRKDGAFTFKARGVMPTSSSPNWASMIMGAGPEQHGITSNDWKLNKHTIEPTFIGPGGIFPTIFCILRQQRPSSKAAVVHDWDDFGRLVEKDMVTILEHKVGPDLTIDRATEVLKELKPDLLFIHLDSVDHAGHKEGWGTPEYYQAVEHVDELIGRVLATLQEAGIADSTFVLVTADHGGLGKSHGGESMAELEIPWIVHGPGVIKGTEITAHVNTYDTAATVAYVLGLERPAAWIAKPVMQAFEK